MKKILVTTAFLLAAITAFAQVYEFIVYSNERPVGRIIEAQEEIIAKEFIFPDRIFEYDIDTITKTITVQLRYFYFTGNLMPNGKIVYYDLTDKRVKWTRNISYSAGNIQQFGSTIILKRKGRSFCLDNETGTNLWRSRNDIYFVDPVANIGVGYKFKFERGIGNTLEGIDLKNGKRI